MCQSIPVGTGRSTVLCSPSVRLPWLVLGIAIILTLASQEKVITEKDLQAIVFNRLHSKGLQILTNWTIVSSWRANLINIFLHIRVENKNN